MHSEQRIIRTARALQAMHVTLTSVRPKGDFEAYHAEIERVYAECMAFSDEEQLPPEGRDPNQRGGWAWWAKKVLEHAG